MAICPNCGAYCAEGEQECICCGTPLSDQEYQDFKEEAYSLDAYDYSNEPEPMPEPQEEAYVEEAPLPVEESETQSARLLADAIVKDFKKQNKTKLFLAIGIGAAVIIGLIFLLVKLLGGNHGSIDASTVAGTYYSESVKVLGVATPITEYYPDGVSVELLDDGTCRFSAGSDSGTGTWRVSGDKISLYDGETTLEGTLVDGVLTLDNMMGSGVSVSLSRQGSAVPQNDTVSEASVNTDWWNNSWYGWWKAENFAGEVTELSESWWDCCATIQLEADGIGHLILWDENHPVTTPVADLEVTVSGDGIGTATTTGGYFLAQSVSDGQYKIEPDNAPYENLIILKGTYSEDGGSCSFEIYLRPWGQLWDDWLTDDPNASPYYYNEKYLPAIQNGIQAPRDFATDW